MTPTPLTAQAIDFLRPLLWEEDDVLDGLTADLIERGPQIQIAPDEGALLHLLLTIIRAERVLELGTLFGYSAIWMARALPPNGHLDTVELSDVHADAAEGWFRRAGLADRITIVRGAALEVLPKLRGPYDALFIDAVKEEYPAYLEHGLRLVRPGGLILADNGLWGGRIGDPAQTDVGVEGIRRYLRDVASHPRLHSTVVAAGDGLAVSLVK